MRLNLILTFFVFCLQDANGLLFDVFKLTIEDSPAEHRQDGEHKQDRDG